uniref:Uncharacterized protein n=1 Tax=Ficedula albicollis TaxID=59894 RepID=A0A803VRU3_FICAL
MWGVESPALWGLWLASALRCLSASSFWLPLPHRLGLVLYFSAIHGFELRLVSHLDVCLCSVKAECPGTPSMALKLFSEGWQVAQPASQPITVLCMFTPIFFFIWMYFTHYSVDSQPQCLPQPNTSALERSEEESGRIQNGHVGLSNGSGIHNGVKHMPADNRKLSSPVSEKMHRKIQSTLSVNSNSNKKSKISSVFSQKQGTSPEGNYFLRAGRLPSLHLSPSLCSHWKGVRKKVAESKMAMWV